MPFDLDSRVTPTPDARARLSALVATLEPDEARVLLMLGERLLSRRPVPGVLDAPVPRDKAGNVSAAVESAVDLALSATAALVSARRQLT